MRTISIAFLVGLFLTFYFVFVYVPAQRVGDEVFSTLFGPVALIIVSALAFFIPAKEKNNSSVEVRGN
ncbi:MAG TPA: hypothetical protein PLK35_03315 [Candidatus Moranbacteria bacterium]|nr:hypothetical protein [Candidatus Moranbacteria bacterium]